MKKTILKTALITLAIAIVLAISIFGIVSLSAPYAMMKFTASMGLDTISGDYAFQEYERSGNIDCLVRSFLIAAEDENYTAAAERFEKIEAEGEKFEAYCKEASVPKGEGIPAYSLRDYVMGRAACVKYALGAEDAIDFAVAETEAAFPEGNPAAALAAAAVAQKDAQFCAKLLSALEGAELEHGAYYETVDAALAAALQTA